MAVQVFIYFHHNVAILITINNIIMHDHQTDAAKVPINGNIVRALRHQCKQLLSSQ